MAKVLAGLSDNFRSVPADYVLPPEKRPQELFPTPTSDVPIIDLSKAKGTERPEVVEQLLKAAQEYGCFQVINHGIPHDLMEKTMDVYREFFQLPYEEISKFTINKTPLNSTKGQLLQYSWKDAFRHHLLPFEEQMKNWPEKPDRFREVVSAYAKETLRIGSEVLELLGEGLGLGKGYFEGDRTGAPFINVNYYPPCPDPSLTLGLYAHADTNLLTILQQDVFGLQLLKDGQWLSVNVIPDGFVFNLATALQVITNGNLKSPVHRVVTNSETSRTSVCTFITPTHPCLLEPAKTFISDSNPPLYRSFTFGEFLADFMSKLGADAETALASFTL